MRHTFIEASAGTGKTYKIMELLGEWMTTHSGNDENILTKVLVLTFTEKAAGELKDRLRKKIIELKQNANNPEIYNRYLTELDQVTISTIHGFCNMVLRAFPVETNASTDWEMGDATERLKEFLYELKHNKWKELNIPNESLVTLLIGTNFFKNFEEIILETASKILSGRQYVLNETNISNFQIHKDSIELEIKSIQKKVVSYFDWISSEPKLSLLSAEGKDKWLNYWKEFKEFLEIRKSLSFELFLGKFFQYFRFPFISMEQGLNDFLPKSKYLSSAKKNEAHVEEISSHTNEVCQSIYLCVQKILKSINIDEFLQQTTLYLVKKVKEEYLDSKWMSYDQMIIAIRDAINTNPALLEILRDKYKICLLDEFQDTDLVQYEIFRKIFFEANDGEHFLYLIGDPKQSIYSFRGGDLGTYLTAKTEIRDESSIPLTVNRRSVKQLISGYNRIFGIQNPGSTFFPIQEIGREENEIRYEEVQAPNEEAQSVKLLAPFNDGPIHIVNLILDSDPANSSKPIKVKISKEITTDRWNEFISFEILKIANSEFCYEKNAQRKDIRFKDIAILVKSRKDGISLESTLRAKNIPCSFYKQTGIYQSRESDQIKNILECLLDPNDPASYRKLLLGDLFQINPAELNYFDEHSIDSYEKKRLDHWRKLIQNNEYAEFFRRLEEDTRIFYTEEEKDLKWERRRTNYRQILQRLLEFQINHQASLPELLDELTKWRIEKSTEQELPLFDKETEEDAVQILTIHASKGLEWPIVFIHGFSSLFQNPICYDYPIKTKEGRSWKLSLWEKNLKHHELTSLNEQRRLLYVALTRPQVRLYLPYCQLSTDKSPYHLFLYKSLQAIMENSEASLPKEEFTLRSFSETEHSQFTPNSRMLNATTSAHSENSLYQCLPHTKLNTKRRLFLHSYSSLKKGTTKETSKTEEQILKLDVIHEPESNFELPSSANTGLFLHSMLEEVPFSLFQNADSDILESEQWNHILEKNMAQYGILNDQTILSEYKNQTFQLLKNSLRAKIPLMGGNSFQLSELTNQERSQEMDFHFLISNLLGSDAAGNFLKGSIDLVLYRDGKYFIADYKSDRLPDYSRNSLSLHLIDYRYDLQRDIYAYIFYEYLKSLFGEEEALKLFGGVFYLFLRGMNENSEEGIYLDLGNEGNGEWNQSRFKEIRNRIDHLVKSSIKEAAI
ncbi:exodeoxyribonuclease V subunit beta [Leptospira ognonensis]|uniref:RecBCD enzyme subunit RecB n=1 Tax=Leptospira ognonensis TaxID=2484945 RepID=A0A4V3JS25_9LEPT|nr:UvrD-helicase domain-containing protein [Leptospira ognonensis]TGL61971.1 exodeoxyribonuclease V subunit beta [Leptospira ognonensis]